MTVSMKSLTLVSTIAEKMGLPTPVSLRIGHLVFQAMDEMISKIDDHDLQSLEGTPYTTLQHITLGLFDMIGFPQAGKTPSLAKPEAGRKLKPAL